MRFISRGLDTFKSYRVVLMVMRVRRLEVLEVRTEKSHVADLVLFLLFAR